MSLREYANYNSVVATQSTGLNLATYPININLAGPSQANVSFPANQFTSIYAFDPNTTILIEAGAIYRATFCIYGPITATQQSNISVFLNYASSNSQGLPSEQGGSCVYASGTASLTGRWSGSLVFKHYAGGKLSLNGYNSSASGTATITNWSIGTMTIEKIGNSANVGYV